MTEQLQVIPIEIAMDAVSDLAKEFSFDEKQEELYRVFIRSCPLIEDKFVDLNLLKNFLANFRQALKTGDSSSLRQERGLKVSRMVDVVEFVESPEYMHQRANLRPVIKYELNRMFHESVTINGVQHEYLECVLGGATGIGKSYMSEMALSYMLYRLSCYRSPQVEFDLAPGSSIFFIIQGKNLNLAKRVAFDQLAARLRLSPYFTKFFPFDPKVKSELRFPNNITILPLGGADTAALGLNVYGGCFPAGQEFLKVNFENTRIDDLSYTGKVITFDGYNLLPSENNIRIIPTGIKPLVKLTFHDGQSIVCSTDQKFKTITDQWVMATEALGRMFVSFTPDYLRSELVCKGIEPWGESEVFDVYNVNHTHAFLAKMQRNHIVAKNSIEEMSYMARTSDSVLTRYTGEDEYDQAERIYNQMIQRIKGRFMQKGKVPGKLLLIGSANYIGDFIHRKRQESKIDPTIFVMHYTQWDALPQERFSGQRFLVEKGNDIKQPRMLNDRSDAIDLEDIIEVPVEYRKEFEKDIISAMKNLAGIEAGPSHPC